MTVNNELRIVGVDGTRPPRVRKAPYIDVVFELSEDANKEWCRDFNALCEKEDYTIKLNVDDRRYIETWLRDMDEIPLLLEVLKAKVAECNQLIADRRASEARATGDRNTALAGEGGEQGRLNGIIADLKFD